MAGSRHGDRRLGKSRSFDGSDVAHCRGRGGAAGLEGNRPSRPGIVPSADDPAGRRTATSRPSRFPGEQSGPNSVGRRPFGLVGGNMSRRSSSNGGRLASAPMPLHRAIGIVSSNVRMGLFLSWISLEEMEPGTPIAVPMCAGRWRSGQILLAGLSRPANISPRRPRVSDYESLETLRSTSVNVLSLLTR